MNKRDFEASTKLNLTVQKSYRYKYKYKFYCPLPMEAFQGQWKKKENKYNKLAIKIIYNDIIKILKNAKNYLKKIIAKTIKITCRVYDIKN